LLIEFLKTGNFKKAQTMNESKPPDARLLCFEIRHSFVIRHSSFVIFTPKG